MSVCPGKILSEFLIMNSKKNFEGIDVFSVNQLEKNVIFID